MRNMDAIGNRARQIATSMGFDPDERVVPNETMKLLMRGPAAIIEPGLVHAWQNFIGTAHLEFERRNPDQVLALREEVAAAVPDQRTGVLHA